MNKLLTPTNNELKNLQEYVNKKSLWINNRIEPLRTALRELCLGEITDEVKKEIDSFVYKISSYQNDLKELEKIMSNVSNLRQKIKVKDIELGKEFKGMKKQARAVLQILSDDLDTCRCESWIEMARTHSHKKYCNFTYEGINGGCICEKQKTITEYPLLAYKNHNKDCFELTRLMENEPLDYWFWHHEKTHEYIDGSDCEGKSCSVRFALNFDGNFLYHYMGTYGEMSPNYDPFHGHNYEKNQKILDKNGIFDENYHSWNRVFYTA